MKLRIRGNSIRLRLTQSEITQLAAEGFVREKTRFPGSAFGYELRTDPHAREVSAVFENGKISVTVPLEQALTWVGTDQVGIEASQPAASDGDLRILIEKDFACTSRRTGEDESDAFPNPLSKTSSQAS
jgi:hypothetical protein